jgi:uncharacterized protein (DUF1330 family)
VAAYLVFTREKMRDREQFKLYQETPRPDATTHPLKVLALYGRVETLEGPSTEGAVILEFPSVDAAKDWYSSPAYQDAARHRFLGADYRVFVVEGQ